MHHFLMFHRLTIIQEVTWLPSVLAEIHLYLLLDTFADAVRVPQNYLEGIWNKAAELLKTDDAIVPAPGIGADAKFILSYRGKRPHLVIPKKGSIFACDSDCPNWKGIRHLRTLGSCG